VGLAPVEQLDHRTDDRQHLRHFLPFLPLPTLGFEAEPLGLIRLGTSYAAHRRRPFLHPLHFLDRGMDLLLV
jgi:hypothetical protein